MMNDFLRDRGRALEDMFFAAQDEKLIQKMRAKEAREATLAALKEATGIQDADLIERLLDQGANAQTLTALKLVPLVTVAWADNRVDNREINAVLSGAEECGIKTGDPAYVLLQNWLSKRPSTALLTAWKDYIASITSAASPETIASMKSTLIGRATKVAKAAGGILGTGGVSAAEKDALEDLEAAFGG